MTGFAMAERIVHFPSNRARTTDKAGPIDTGGGGGNDGGMDARLAKLEAVVPTLATKEDLVREIGSVRAEIHKEINAQTWRLVTFVTGFGTALVAATYFVAKYVH